MRSTYTSRPSKSARRLFCQGGPSRSDDHDTGDSYYRKRDASGWSPPFRLAEMITDSVGQDGVRIVVENGVVHVIYTNSEDYDLYHIRISD